MSSTQVTGIAPCLISSFVLYELSLVILPGIQNISLPCSSPKSTVIRVPLFPVSYKHLRAHETADNLVCRSMH